MCRLHAGQRGRSLDSACMHARVPTRPFNRWLRDLQSLTHAHRPGAREGVEAAGAVGPEVCQAFCQRGAVKNCSSLTPENAAVPYILRLSLLRQRSQMSSPSLVPETSGAVHMVLDDFGKLGRAWREMDEQKTTKCDVVYEIIYGAYNRPIRIVAFDLEERWVRDVTEDVARAVIVTARAEGLMLGKVA